MPDAVARDAYSQEVSSAGFWPGGGTVTAPCYYSYAYPAPKGFAEARVQPDATSFNAELGEFLMPYEIVRRSADPDATLLTFLQSTYEAAANLGGRNRQFLEGSDRTHRASTGGRLISIAAAAASSPHNTLRNSPDPVFPGQ